ncbi:hypothetical protein ACMU1B_001747 [Campylobacter jejuni]|uniref:hypothetical protein n=1 Tax=Campylobacter jejuni TaxID=197 RepID=UPI00073DCE93|nr:hypothetical protein [Campylobacter jejuni]ALW49306.1 hypothetical protein RC01_04720 [Campylobacter jejuni]ALW65280.1 hypothetical protein RC32_04655 [Campylobacter jejuni]ALW68513.1 hypothetical protein RC06_04705 [Campylobacter jejuni]EAK8099022.1 hypothetical protein [Campylobacter jejuni]EAL0578676.1 hypothetical protein [Campylobacter jejuni]
MKKYLLTIEIKNFNYLNKIKLETKTSLNKIINYIIKEYREKNKNSNIKNDYKLIDNSNIIMDKETKEIRIKLTDKEFKLLKENAINNNFKSATKEAKFLLINSLNKYKFFSNDNILEFIKTRTEINAIGKNLYQLLKVLRSRNFIKINDENFKNTINNLNDKLDLLLEQLGIIIEKNNQRI